MSNYMKDDSLNLIHMHDFKGLDYNLDKTLLLVKYKKKIMQGLTSCHQLGITLSQ
jgi:hypothetical protein